MAALVRKHGVLLLVFVATVLLYTHGTVPAMERNRALAEIERRKAAELDRLRDEALRKEVMTRAIESGDPAVMERAVRDRFAPEGQAPDRAASARAPASVEEGR